MLKKCDALYFTAKNAILNFFHKENGEVNVVAIVVLIAVAVVLALFFKDQISKILKDLLGSIGTKSKEALNDVG